MWSERKMLDGALQTQSGPTSLDHEADISFTCTICSLQSDLPLAVIEHCRRLRPVRQDKQGCDAQNDGRQPLTRKVSKYRSTLKENEGHLHNEEEPPMADCCVRVLHGEGDQTSTSPCYSSEPKPVTEAKSHFLFRVEISYQPNEVVS